MSKLTLEEFRKLPKNQKMEQRHGLSIAIILSRERLQRQWVKR